MEIKSTDEIYDVIEQALQHTSGPQTCVSLMEQHAVRRAVLKRFGNDVQEATNKLSDLLGFMWRRRVLERYPAPSTHSKARYAYTLTHQMPEQAALQITPHQPKFTITEHEHEVLLDFDGFTLVIRSK